MVIGAAWLGACAAPGDPATAGSTDTARTEAGPTEARQAPAYMTARKSCAVVVGGSVGNALPDPKTAEYWYQVNMEVADEVMSRLLAEQFRVSALAIAPAQNLSVRRLALEALNRRRCDRLIYLANTVDEDVRGKFFRYDISVLHLEQKGERQSGETGINVTTVTDYQRAYRFARNEATFEAFRSSALATSIVADLKASGVLGPLR